MSVPSIEIHIVTYNEEIMLPFTLQHYKKMFSNVTFVIHDNYSTDNTVQIATDAGCSVELFDSEGGMNDVIHAKIKETAILNSNADWVLCIDCDEECFINDNDLMELNIKGINAVQFEGWNIFDAVNTPFDIVEPMGIQDSGYSKPVLYKGKQFFKDIHLAVGIHTIHNITPSEGNIVNWSKNEYKLLHYKHWSIDWNLKRSAELSVRQSDTNKKHSYSYHFALPENVHRQFFETHYNNRIKIELNK